MGSDPSCPSLTATSLCFNSRSRMGSDAVQFAVLATVEVSIHAPAWGATLTLAVTCPVYSVSIHAPAWGATRPPTTAPGRARVSIHAPAWGATPDSRALNPRQSGFNSRSRMGSDPCALRRGHRHTRFNSRSRMGSDQNEDSIAQLTNVSIHAPAWGATCPSLEECRSHDSFNSRSRMGSDPLVSRLAKWPRRFQFTLPHGERLPGGPVRRSCRQVSIHAPAWGATAPHQASRISRGVSIHAPAWGATLACPFCDTKHQFQFTLPHGERPTRTGTSFNPRRFNSRSRMGSDRGGLEWPASRACFNSRSRMGSDHKQRSQKSYLQQFQFTLPHGERPRRSVPTVMLIKVSIHAPAWGATESPGRTSSR